VPRQIEKAEPGESVQVDVKFVKIAGRWAFQYTALDDCTRYRRRTRKRCLHQRSCVAFLAELTRALPFRMRKLQCDNGREFPLEFVLAVQAAGIRHRYIRPRRPQQNGKVERSHRIDQEESGAATDSTISTQPLPPPSVGENVQLRTLLPRPAGAHALDKRAGVAARPCVMAVMSTTDHTAEVNLDESQHVAKNPLDAFRATTYCVGV